MEDPSRSGWQLVFVDREEDVLLVGDDPWQYVLVTMVLIYVGNSICITVSYLFLTTSPTCREFVNSVSFIKILSPQEVQQMGKGLEFLSSAPGRRLGSSCDDYVGRQESRSLSNGIASVGSVEF